LVAVQFLKKGFIISVAVLLLIGLPSIVEVLAALALFSKHLYLDRRRRTERARTLAALNAPSKNPMQTEIDVLDTRPTSEAHGRKVADNAGGAAAAAAAEIASSDDSTASVNSAVLAADLSAATC
jgi:hypothetical protein